MATSRTTLSSVLNTVTTTADTLTGAIGTINTAVGMASTAINDAARRQEARSKLDSEFYKDTISMEKAMELELQTDQVNEWLDQKPERAERYNATYARLRALLN